MNNTNTSVSSQRARILERLKRGSVTTLELIEEENVLRPGARIAELRTDGHPIKTHLMDVIDPWGRKHGRCALYYLSSNGSAEVAA